MREDLQRKEQLVAKVRDDKATVLKDAEGVKGALQETRDELVTTTQVAPDSSGPISRCTWCMLSLARARALFFNFAFETVAGVGGEGARSCNVSQISRRGTAVGIAEQARRSAGGACRVWVVWEGEE